MRFCISIFMICCFAVLFPAYAQTSTAVGTTYGKTITYSSNSADPKERDMAKQIQSMDNMAAERGDSFAMAGVASNCLTQKDFPCAFKWSALALRGSIWWIIGDFRKVFSIHDAARENMSESEIREAEQSIKYYISEKLSNIPQESLDELNKQKTVTMTREEAQKKVEALEKLQAMANINFDKMTQEELQKFKTAFAAAKTSLADAKAMSLLGVYCFNDKDYACALKWETLSLSGGYVWATHQATSILAYRDAARRALTPEQRSVVMDNVFGILTPFRQE